MEKKNNGLTNSQAIVLYLYVETRKNDNRGKTQTYVLNEAILKLFLELNFTGGFTYMLLHAKFEQSRLRNL